MSFKPLAIICSMLILAHHSFLMGEDQLPTIKVVKDGTGQYKTIQEAIDQSPDNATIEIGPGDWIETLKITHPVTLKGAGWDQTHIIASPKKNRVPSKELEKVLGPIMKELDQETIQKFRIAYLKVYGVIPALDIQNTKNVVIQEISFSIPNRSTNKGLQSMATVEIQDSEVLINNSAILDSPGIGINCNGESHVNIKNSLITNCWNRGITVMINASGSFELRDSEIRNNRYAGISIRSASDKIQITHCLIHGTGWHGIRYDNSAPVIKENVFHTTAVSGIYASGKTKATIKNNLFYHSGISCWFQNNDTIESNTFIGDDHSEKKSGITQGLSVLGASTPTITNNIFINSKNGIYQGKINSKSSTAKISKTIKPENNLFWNNETNISIYNKKTEEQDSIDLPKGNLEEEPEFVDAKNQEYELKKDSALIQTKIGARNFASLKSSWAIQDQEEKTIKAVNERMKQTLGFR